MTLNGWRLIALVASIILLLLVAAAGWATGTAEAARMVIRWTARLSLILFLMAFTASAMVRLAPGAYTIWQRRNRRYLGLSFALSHFVHLGAILTLASVDPDLFWKLTNLVTILTGGLAYVFIAAMAASSFDRVAAAMGARLWHGVHRFGAWYICISFVFTFGKRAVMDAAYLPAMVLIAAALLVRLLAYIKTSRSSVAG
jgi:DMSO/TMAO reductase YedYZ heme-binding membrane subunit